MPPSVAAASNQMGKCKRNLEISVWNINKQIYEKYEMWAPELIPVLCSREIPMKGRQRKKEANEREKTFSLFCNDVYVYGCYTAFSHSRSHKLQTLDPYHEENDIHLLGYIFCIKQLRLRRIEVWAKYCTHLYTFSLVL